MAGNSRTRRFRATRRAPVSPPIPFRRELPLRRAAIWSLPGCPRRSSSVTATPSCRSTTRWVVTWITPAAGYNSSTPPILLIRSSVSTIATESRVGRGERTATAPRWNLSILRSCLPPRICGLSTWTTAIIGDPAANWAGHPAGRARGDVKAAWSSTRYSPTPTIRNPTPSSSSTRPMRRSTSAAGI